MAISMESSNARCCGQKTAQHKSSELSPASSGKKRANIEIQQKQHELLTGFGYNHNPSQHNSNAIVDNKNLSNHCKLLLVDEGSIQSYLAFITGEQKQQLQQQKALSDITLETGHDKRLLIATKPISEHNRGAICQNQLGQLKSSRLVTKQSKNNKKSCSFATKTLFNHIQPPTTRFQFVIIVILSIVTYHNAPTCLALGISDYNFHTGLAGYSYVSRTYSKPPRSFS